MFHAGLECSWYPWGFDSCKYVEVWRLFVEIVRARTCRTAFMWAPAEAGGYPFTGLIALPLLPSLPLAPPPTPLHVGACQGWSLSFHRFDCTPSLPSLPFARPPPLPPPFMWAPAKAAGCFFTGLCPAPQILLTVAVKPSGCLVESMFIKPQLNCCIFFLV